MESLLKTLWRRLRFYLIDWGLIARRGIFYIGGSDTLPPPLEREKEAELIARMDEGDESVRGTLIEHNHHARFPVTEENRQTYAAQAAFSLRL